MGIYNNDKYFWEGFFYMKGNPLTGNIYELVGVPWRQ